MPEGTGAKRAAEDEGGRIWRGLKALFHAEPEPSLREQLEEAIDEHESASGEDEPPAGPNGDLSPVERQMLRNLLHFSEHSVDDVAVPRADIVAIEEGASFAAAVALFAEHGHSRLPVYQGDLDHIVGMLHIKDLFAVLATGDPYPDGFAQFIRQPRFVPESMGVLDLLAEMRATRTHLAVVLDEYSGTEGLVTIEDIVEEIVGEIEDEHDEEPSPRLVPLDEGLWEADARTELAEAARVIDPALAQTEEDVDTLGGLTVVLAGQVPPVGTIVEDDSGWKLEVVEGDEKRVTRLRLHPPPELEPAAA